MANNRPTLYVGVTSDLVKRVYEHKTHGDPKSFTSRYALHNLVYFEVMDNIESAIIREKQLKDMNRNAKLILIRKKNPDLVDLYSTII